MVLQFCRNLFTPVVAFCLLSCSGCCPLGQTTLIISKKTNDAVSSEQAIRMLKEGNQRFVQGHLAEKNILQNRSQLIFEQKPIAVIISCSDSRVTPEIVFDQSLGDIFVIRVAGNIINDDVLGSIGYAMDYLNVQLIMILGHQNCGAVIEALNRRNIPDYLLPIVNKIQPAVKKGMASGATGVELVDKTVIENIKIVEDELSESPTISKKLLHGEVKIVGGEYQLTSGKVFWLN